MTNKFLMAAIFFVVFVSDQITKHMVTLRLELNEIIEVVPNFFNITRVHNEGAAFGMFSNLPDPWRHIVIGGVSVLALIVLIRFLLVETRSDAWAQYAQMGILGGAIGNISDRFRFDHVVDFLDFYLAGTHFPSFNIADSAISVGVFVLIIRMFFYESDYDLAKGKGDLAKGGTCRGNLPKRI